MFKENTFYRVMHGVVLTDRGICIQKDDVIYITKVIKTRQTIQCGYCIIDFIYDFKEIKYLTWSTENFSLLSEVS